MTLQRHQIERVVALALDEDAPFGDVTSQTFVPATTTATAELVAREPGVFAGAEVFEVAMTALDATVKVTLLTADGDRFEAGAGAGPGEGPARAVLQAERVALNLVQRMCGVATLTARYVADVDAVAGARRPGGRHPQDHPGPARPGDVTPCAAAAATTTATRLSDAVMAKDNHLAVVDDIGAAIRRARRGAAAHHAPRGGGRPARPAGRGAGRRAGHDHARQLLPRRPRSRASAGSTDGPSSRPPAASPWTPSPPSPRPGST